MRLNWPIRTLWTVSLLALVLALGAGCAGSDPGSGGGGESDASDTGDVAAPDSADGDGGTDVIEEDVGVLDTSTDADDSGPDVEEPREVGEPCSEDFECITEVCVDVIVGDEGEGICSQQCEEDADCPREYDCVFLGGSGVDAQRVCLPVDLCFDSDMDGYGIGPGCLGADCDDNDGRANIGADEVCDGIDNDCDEEIDDNTIDTNMDCDTGFDGACAEGRTVCGETGLIECVSRTGPRDEICDGLDNDCDGSEDEDDLGEPLARQCYDGNTDLIGTGVCQWGRQTCRDGGFSACIGQRLPMPEMCDGEDNDCDGFLDEGLATTSFYPDADADGFGDATADPLMACERPVGFVENFSDCNDSDRLIRPGAAEIPGDGVDQNCDGSEFCFEDADDDGYRTNSSATIISADGDCDDPGEATSITPDGDCADDNELVYPGAEEACDNVDNDCDSREDEGNRCYPVGETCEDPIDCATELCEENICTRPLTCIDLGTCPTRITQASGGGQGTSERFILQLSAGGGNVSPVLDSERFRMVVGPQAYVSDP